jgi:hypothetical protein
MLKQLVALVLILLLSTPYVSRLLSYTSFKANQSYIAATLCGNRDKPEIHCLGLCYFEKQMQKHQGADKVLSAPSQKQEEPAIIASNPFSIPFFEVVSVLSLPQTPHRPSGYLDGVFHPPQV